MSQDNAMLDNEIMLLPIDCLVLLFTPHTDQLKMIQIFRKCITEKGEIIYEDFQKSLHHIKKKKKKKCSCNIVIKGISIQKFQQIKLLEEIKSKIPVY